MPLPFAPPPKDSSLYQQLESTTLQTLTADQLDTIKGKTFSQGTEGNEDEYRRLLLLGMVADKISLSGPIPGTQTIVEDTQTGTGYFTVLTPGVGEVWQFIGASASGTTGLTGNRTTEIDIYNATDDLRVLLIDVSSSSTSDYPLGETNFAPIYIAYPNVCRYRLEGTFDSAQTQLCFIRVR